MYELNPERNSENIPKKVLIYVYLQFKSEFTESYLALTSLKLPLSLYLTRVHCPMLSILTWQSSQVQWMVSVGGLGSRTTLYPLAFITIYRKLQLVEVLLGC